jgi:hypothetical protein
MAHETGTGLLCKGLSGIVISDPAAQAKETKTQLLAS